MALGQVPLEPFVSPSSGPGPARRLAESFSAPIQLPISLKPKDKGRVRPGSIVFQPSDSISLWTLSARLPKKDFVILYGIEGPQAGTWKEASAAEFSSYWAVDEDEGVAIRNLVLARRPVGYDLQRLDILYQIMAVSNAADLLVSRIPFPDVLNVGDSEGVYQEFVATAITALELARDGVDAAGSAYDALAIGQNALALIREAGRGVYMGAKRIYEESTRYEQDGPVALLKASQVMLEISQKFTIWSLYLRRALILTQLTDLSEMTGYMTDALVIEGTIRATFDAAWNNDEIFDSGKITEDYLDGAVSFWNAIFNAGFETDASVRSGTSAYLKASGFSPDDLYLAQQALLMCLDANLSDIQEVAGGPPPGVPLIGPGLGYTMDNVPKKYIKKTLDLLVAVTASVRVGFSKIKGVPSPAEFQSLKNTAFERFKEMYNLMTEDIRQAYAFYKKEYAANLARGEKVDIDVVLRNAGNRIVRLTETLSRDRTNLAAKEEREKLYDIVKVLRSIQMDPASGVLSTIEKVDKIQGENLEAIKAAKNLAELEGAFRSALMVLLNPMVPGLMRIAFEKRAWEGRTLRIFPEEVIARYLGHVHTAFNLDPALTWNTLVRFLGYDAKLVERKLTKEEIDEQIKSNIDDILKLMDGQMEYVVEGLMAARKLPEIEPMVFPPSYEKVLKPKKEFGFQRVKAAPKPFTSVRYGVGLGKYKEGIYRAVTMDNQSWGMKVRVNSVRRLTGADLPKHGQSQGSIPDAEPVDLLEIELFKGEVSQHKVSDESINWVRNTVKNSYANRELIDFAPILDSMSESNPIRKDLADHVANLNEFARIYYTRLDIEKGGRWHDDAVYREAKRILAEAKKSGEKVEIGVDFKALLGERADLIMDELDHELGSGVLSLRDEDIVFIASPNEPPKKISYIQLYNEAKSLNEWRKAQATPESQSTPEYVQNMDTLNEKLYQISSTRAQLGPVRMVNKVRDIMGKIFNRPVPGENNGRERSRFVAFVQAAAKSRIVQVVTMILAPIVVGGALGLGLGLFKGPLGSIPRDPKPPDPTPISPSDEITGAIVTAALVGIPLFLLLRKKHQTGKKA